MTAVMCMGNFWNWSGGFGQYLAWAGKGSIPYPPPAEGGDWATYQFFASSFYKNKTAVGLYVNTLAKVITRVNTITGKPYTQDPTIMSWQLGNEPRGVLNGFAFRKWIRKMTSEIKSLDANHLVTIGSEGRTSSSFAGNRFTKDHKSDDVDYTTAHLWVQNWGWYDPAKSETSLPDAIVKGQEYIRYHAELAQKINKPLILEEFGISRDLNNHDPMASVQVRDAYYTAIFQEIYDLAKAGTPVSGVNFWAWGGEGRPRVPEGFWKAGDDFLGDPPHESQGWYSVYETDSTTQAIILKYAKLMSELP
jgi:mannan endo-1,4-beta-mannosidase